MTPDVVAAGHTSTSNQSTGETENKTSANNDNNNNNNNNNNNSNSNSNGNSNNFDSSYHLPRISHNTSQQQQSPPHPPRPRNHKHLAGKGLSGQSQGRVASSRQAPTTKDPVQANVNNPRPLPTVVDPANRASLATAPTVPAVSAAASGTTSNHRRRISSESKLPRKGGSTANTANNAEPNTKNTTHSNLKLNKSQADVRRRIKSEKPRRTLSSTTILPKPHLAVPGDGRASTKTQVQFDLGNEGEEDEWVDASASASPQLSRKPSIASDHNFGVENTDEPDNNRLTARQTSREPRTGDATVSAVTEQVSRDKERVNHQEYLTSLLLQRTPSTSTRQLSTQMASAALPDGSASIPPESSAFVPTSATGTADSHKDGVTSWFLVGSSSGLPDSFRNPLASSGRQEGEVPRRRRSIGAPEPHRTRLHHGQDGAPDERVSDLTRHHRRSTPRALEHYRTQQKLELQRASSVVEPGQGLGGAAAIVAANPLVTTQGDPRVGKLLERTDMEYQLVRRFQDPVARSLWRLDQINGAERRKRVLRANTGLPGGLDSGQKSSDRDGSGLLGRAHNASAPDLEAIRAQHSSKYRRPSSVRFVSTSADFEETTPVAEVFCRGVGDSTLADGAGTGEGILDHDATAGFAHEDTIVSVLQALWEKPAESSAA